MNVFLTSLNVIAHLMKWLWYRQGQVPSLRLLPTHSSYPVGTGGSFPRDKAAETLNRPLFPFKVNVKLHWVLLPLQCTPSWSSTKEEVNFTFYSSLNISSTRGHYVVNISSCLHFTVLLIFQALEVIMLSTYLHIYISPNISSNRGHGDVNISSCFLWNNGKL
jgi:hypothetical protein